MPTTIEVNKQSVKTLLESGKDHPFVIPEYQRPYAWEFDQIQTLFDDLWDFTTSEEGGSEGKNTYFLGTIVAYENEKQEQEIIDGQQRITSLFLLLRAIYTTLENISEDKQTKTVKNFIKQIEPAIWRTDKFTGEVKHSDILITSRVLNNEGNSILKNILETGKAKEDATDNYSKNYRKFQELYLNASKENPLMIYEFIYVVLNKAILLPITADNQDTALTIFSTLNDRGLPLSDADIFKAKIYNHLEASQKADFIEKWKDLDRDATESGESIQQLFYYYMFYLRANEKDNKTTTPGIRKYYSSDSSEKKVARLFDKNLIDNLFVVLQLWKVVNSHSNIENENWSTDTSVLQALDILSSYPNEFWKYPVIIYYLTHKQNDQFASYFGKFLHKLIKELLTKYLMVPTINAVKADILKLNVEITSSLVPQFDFRQIDMAQLKEKMKLPHRNAVRMILKILAYEKQDDFLPEKWEIEHIFPQKWQANYFPSISDEIIKERIEHIGNKLPFEKRLNIVAGNGYFQKKQIEYNNSKIRITADMASSIINDWNLDSILERDIRISDEIFKILERWENEYKNTPRVKTSAATPTEEDLAKIKEFKEKGWI